MEYIIVGDQQQILLLNKEGGDINAYFIDAMNMLNQLSGAMEW